MRALQHSLRRAKHALKMFIERPESEARRAHRQFEEFSALSDSRFAPTRKDMLFIGDEATAATTFDRHYVYHTAWAARVLAQTRPTRHTDLASLIDFCATVSAVLPIEHYELRPPDIELSNLSVGQADLTQLPFEDRSISSLSCMHVVEHVGLGRYGEPLAPTGDITAMRELARVLAPGGDLLFVVPVGRPRVVFNAHRVYSLSMIMDAFSDLELVEFVLIPDSALDGHLIPNADARMVEAQRFGCGCFWFHRSAK
jgi:SAM-dependent methyltransferase